MKKFKSAMIAALSGVMLFSSCSFFATGVQAKSSSHASETGNDELISYPRDAYEFNANEILNVYALNSVENELNDNGNIFFYVKHTLDVTNKNAVPMRAYKADGTLVHSSPEVDFWSDGYMNAVDASNVLCLQGHVNGIADLPEKSWPDSAEDVQWTLAKALNLNKEDVTVETETIYQKIAGVEGAESEQSTTISSATGVTTENEAALLRFTTLDRKVYIAKYKETHNDKTDEQLAAIFENAKALPTQETVRVKATTKDGVVYRLAIGNDNKFYLIGPDKEQTESEFKTTLDYASEEKGKMDGDTYLPPYYANEEKNAKKDLDATAFIRSVTREAIVETNGVALTADGKANSEGWYYPETADKSVIAKVYPFEKYDNTEFNGAVKETVKLVGAEGGEDTQKPSIRWTFRLINKDTKENADGSVTVTLTYNLPVDKDSIPEGWSPVYDKDGKTIHSITKTIKKGEDYDKDVTVKRNGEIDEKVTTHVKQVWEKLSPTLPQTGAFSVVLVVLVAGIAGFAITRFRKFRK